MLRLPLTAGFCALALAAPAVASPERTITPIAEAERGTMVTLHGTVDRLLDEDEFRLRDETGAMRVYVGPNWVPADPGETITVHGFVDDEPFLPRELYARQITRADGTVVELSRGYE
ncbi:MAG: NirD/YgiW/YdeI family stress tolerance protein [Pseudomonadota bacterium]